jgi:hypothetical protein
MMSRLQLLRPFGFENDVTPPQAQVWDCFNKGQVLAAAFEVHEAAMHAGFMPDEATTLSLSLAELATNSVSSSRGAVASVFFNETGWRLEVADTGPSLERYSTPELNSQLPRQLTSLRSRPAGPGKVVIAEYERPENA